MAFNCGGTGYEKFGISCVRFRFGDSLIGDHARNLSEIDQREESRGVAAGVPAGTVRKLRISEESPATFAQIETIHASSIQGSVHVGRNNRRACAAALAEYPQLGIAGPPALRDRSARACCGFFLRWRLGFLLFSLVFFCFKDDVV